MKENCFTQKNKAEDIKFFYRQSMLKVVDYIIMHQNDTKCMHTWMKNHPPLYCQTCQTFEVELKLQPHLLPLDLIKSHTLENNKSEKQNITNVCLKDFDIPKGWLM